MKSSGQLKFVLKKLVVFTITLEARLVLKKYKPKIVAITGNAGKTGVKDAIAAILGSEFSIWKNEKSYNSDIGIPLTILHCKNGWSDPMAWLKNLVGGLVLILFPHKYPEWLVLEIGADKPGDISKFTKWITPDIVVVTLIGKTPVHLENFPSREKLLAEKAELVKALKVGGTLVLNADDPDVLSMSELPKLAKIITYGFSAGSTLMASNCHASLSELSFKVDYAGNIIPVRMPAVVGRQNVYSALAGLAVGASLNINFISMLDSINSYERPAGRLKLVEGTNGSTILDDTYNSSPAALKLAMESAAELKGQGKLIAVLGDMLELGGETEKSHYEIGKNISPAFDLLITVGQRAENFCRGAIDGGMNTAQIKSFVASPEAGEYLAGIVGDGDLILIKGSQGIRMERVVERIMRHTEDKIKILARQEEEWRKR